MANQKDTPNLPSSSRMQMPSTGGNATSGLIKENSGMSNGNKVSKKVMSGALSKGMKGTNPYCD